MKTYKTYAILDGADESILLLNDYLKNEGFEFHKISFKTAQNKFHDLFGYIKKSERQIQLDEDFIDEDFFNHIQKTNIRPNVIFGPRYFILLSPIITRQVDDNLTTSPFDTSIHAKLQNFLFDFIRRLRLFKSGKISVTTTFEICEETGRISMTTFSNHATDSLSNIYKLNESEIDTLKIFLKQELFIQDWSELAINNFELYYQISNNKIKFTTLMTSLECLFNTGKDQIAHTISRHVSLIASSNTESFQENYKNMKKLYGIRNSLIHGSGSTEPTKEINSLENNVRLSLKYVLFSDTTKIQLFEKLNRLGYDE